MTVSMPYAQTWKMM